MKSETLHGAATGNEAEGEMLPAGSSTCHNDALERHSLFTSGACVVQNNQPRIFYILPGRSYPRNGAFCGARLADGRGGWHSPPAAERPLFCAEAGSMAAWVHRSPPLALAPDTPGRSGDPCRRSGSLGAL